MGAPRKSHNLHLWQEVVAKVSEHSLHEIDQLCASFRYKKRAKELRAERTREERKRKEEERQRRRELDEQKGKAPI